MIEAIEAHWKVQQARATLMKGVARAVWKISGIERGEGTLLETVRVIRDRKNLAFARDWTFGELLEWAADTYRHRPFLEFGTQVFSFIEMNRRANRVAHNLMELGIGENVGVAIMMGNHPRFLDTFFAVQKLGGYVVPVNTALVGDGLQYILEHSQIRFVVCDHESAEQVACVREQLPDVTQVWVNTDEAQGSFTLPDGMLDYAELERGTAAHGDNVRREIKLGTPSLLLYTSGTTGLPKAVVSPYGGQRVKNLGLLSNLLYTQEDKLYTCLPLFHANALMLSVMNALWIGIALTLKKRFSASRFWQELGECGATQFNTVGSMIPILLKTAPGRADRAHKVRRVISAACPKDAWVPFEQRFGVTLWEGYGAVDGAGVTIFNAGNAPIGSLGKLPRGVKWRLVDEQGKEVGEGESGELWVFVGDKRESRVEYWRNDKASSDKVVDGWLRSGDLMQRDAKGFLYFVGRNTDSMRRRGENVSAYEVEKVVDQHPDVLESAAFGVPSPVGEQDIMICVVPVDGKQIDARGLARFLQERLPKYAQPSHLDVVSELPKTGTHRVIKAALKKRGVTDATVSLEGL
ncbi:MAG: fadD1 [Myxococcaceae bacterium]|nr:fadD1 [Myxococcaceae bacterium]